MPNKPFSGEILFDENGLQMCSARVGDGAVCEITKIYSNGRCGIHGGNSPKGPRSSRYKTGRWSKYAVTALAEKYSELLEDEEIVSVRDDIALIDARIATLLERADEGGSTYVFEEIEEAFAAFDAARNDSDRIAMSHALRDLRAAIAKGRSEGLVWKEISDLMEQRRKMAATEHKRMTTMGQFISVEQANGLIAALLAAVRAEVKDGEIRQRLGDQFRTIATRGFSGAGTRKREEIPA